MHTHTHTRTYTHPHTHAGVCVCVCVPPDTKFNQTCVCVDVCASGKETVVKYDLYVM
jgi:hypothetical protein